ncbi:hypothetical protein F5887DRAFT_969351 [Amanita rubescens]|nr:hypothetical protein F5887DRAFT_969351 [Amanita rubescens]
MVQFIAATSVVFIQLAMLIRVCVGLPIESGRTFERRAFSERDQMELERRTPIKPIRAFRAIAAGVKTAAMVINGHPIAQEQQQNQQNQQNQQSPASTSHTTLLTSNPMFKYRMAPSPMTVGIRKDRRYLSIHTKVGHHCSRRTAKMQLIQVQTHPELLAITSIMIMMKVSMFRRPFSTSSPSAEHSQTPSAGSLEFILRPTLIHFSNLSATLLLNNGSIRRCDVYCTRSVGHVGTDLVWSSCRTWDQV